VRRIRGLASQIIGWLYLWRLEIGIGIIFLFFLLAVMTAGYIHAKMGWIAFCFSVGIVCLHQRGNMKKERELMHKTQELSNVIRHLAETKQMLLRLGDLKNKFISTVNHEIRTPLTAIQECMNLITEGIAGPVSSRQQDFLGMALRNVQRLTVLLNNLMDLSRLESGGLKASLSKVSLEEVVQEVIHTLHPRAQKKGVSLLMEIKSNLPAALVDRQRVVQVLNDLVDNAIKFTDAGGRAGVSARFVEESKELEICVWDTGCGMSEGDAQQLFGRFHQISRGESLSPTTGAGLGLHLCKEIITQLGGSIWLESQPGQGSRFYFTLLCYSDEALLRTHFHDAVREALSRNVSLLHLGVHMRAFDALCQSHGKHALEEILRDIHVFVTSCFRADDRIVVDFARGRIHVLMVSDNPDMHGRIRKLDEYLSAKTFFAQETPMSLKFLYGIAKFPQHGEDLEGMLAAIEAQVNSGGLDVMHLPMEGAA